MTGPQDAAQAEAAAYLAAVTNAPVIGIAKAIESYGAKLRAAGRDLPQEMKAAAVILQDPGAASFEQLEQAMRAVVRFNASEAAAAP